MIYMPDYSYSFQKYEKSRHVRAAIRDKSISHKHSREIALAINNKSIEKAREFLEDVLTKKSQFLIGDIIMRLLIDQISGMVFALGDIRINPLENFSNFLIILSPMQSTKEWIWID